MNLTLINRRYFMTALLLAFCACCAYGQTGLFESDEVLAIKLKGSLRSLLNDRSSAKPKDFPLVLTVANEDSGQLEIPVLVRTRGNFRRMKENCKYPPLFIQFSKKSSHLNSVFKEQKKTKTGNALQRR